MTLTTFAQHLGFAQSELSAYLTGARKPSFVRVVLFAKTFGSEAFEKTGFGDAYHPVILRLLANEDILDQEGFQRIAELLDNLLDGSESE